MCKKDWYEDEDIKKSHICAGVNMKYKDVCDVRILLTYLNLIWHGAILYFLKLLNPVQYFAFYILIKILKVKKLVFGKCRLKFHTTGIYIMTYNSLLFRQNFAVVTYTLEHCFVFCQPGFRKLFTRLLNNTIKVLE